jgi:uncharacterized membrane protein
MGIGPVEYIIIAFPGNRFNGEIVPALQHLVEQGTINILDLVFVKKDNDGNVDVIELENSAYDEVAAFAGLDGEIGNLFNEEDLILLAQDIPNNNSAALLVWENAWAARFAEAVRGAQGEVLANGRIPHAVVQAAIDAAVDAAAEAV